MRLCTESRSYIVIPDFINDSAAVFIAMGTHLSKPITEKTSGGGRTVTDALYAYSAMQGWREGMEVS